MAFTHNPPSRVLPENEVLLFAWKKSFQLDGQVSDVAIKPYFCENKLSTIHHLTLDVQLQFAVVQFIVQCQENWSARVSF